MVREVQPRDGKEEEVLKAEPDLHEASGADKLAVSGSLGLIDLLRRMFSRHVLHLVDHMMVFCGFPVCQRQENKSFVV